MIGKVVDIENDNFNLYEDIDQLNTENERLREDVKELMGKNTQVRMQMKRYCKLDGRNNIKDEEEKRKSF